MKKLFNKILDILFPKKCVFCAKKLDTEYKICLCLDCREKAFIKNVAMRQFEKKFFEKIVCAMDYKNTARKMFLKFKFRNIRYLKETYAEMIFFKIKNDKDYTMCDFVTSVPLSSERYNERGYNQSALIAKEVAKKIDKPYFDDVILKIKDTKPFSKMTLNQRRKEVRGSYIFNEKYDVTGKDILLIDDIYTSGATINECSKILKMYGANAVYCAAVFSAELGR